MYIMTKFVSKLPLTALSSASKHLWLFWMSTAAVATASNPKLQVAMQAILELSGWGKTNRVGTDVVSGSVCRYSI